ncbi:MAG: ABC transporter permease, partial [Deltaproteobacteria bacterium]|nr:ABC transporter permease [Deltaproteobacteria bacterium]
MFNRPLLIVQLFLRSSRVQKKRAILTIAAIAWSSLSLLMLLAFGEGLKRQLLLSDSGIGRNIAIMWPGETTRPWNGMPAGRPIRPRVEDIELISQRVANLYAVSGEGASLSYGEIRNHIPRPGGRFLNPLDEQLRRRVIFLGDDLAAELFGDEEPVGASILVENVPYTVIGVLIDKFQGGTYGGPDASHGVIPITTFEAQFGENELENIVVKPLRAELMPAVLKGVYETLGAKYGFDPEDERVLGTWNTVEGAVLMGKIMMGIQGFLGIIG